MAFDTLVERLRGQYRVGPHLPNGDPEFGWRQFQAPPIQHDAAARIEELEAERDMLLEALERCDKAIQEWWPRQTTVSQEGVAAIEAGRLANETIAKIRDKQ